MKTKTKPTGDLTFREYQIGTRSTAEYAAEKKEPERKQRVETLGSYSIAEALREFVKAGHTFDEYKKFIRDGATPKIGYGVGGYREEKIRQESSQWFYVLFGLLSEAGEVAEKYLLYLEGSIDRKDVQREMKKELGDILWYVSELSTNLFAQMGDVAQANLNKLASRKARGKIHGSGDDR
jgi:NTP pyrophosphatase (non-canonical NTP hydrolase)